MENLIFPQRTIRHQAIWQLLFLRFAVGVTWDKLALPESGRLMRSEPARSDGAATNQPIKWIKQPRDVQVLVNDKANLQLQRSEPVAPMMLDIGAWQDSFLPHRFRHHSSKTAKKHKKEPVPDTTTATATTTTTTTATTTATTTTAPTSEPCGEEAEHPIQKKHQKRRTVQRQQELRNKNKSRGNKARVQRPQDKTIHKDKKKQLSKQRHSDDHNHITHPTDTNKKVHKHRRKTHPKNESNNSNTNPRDKKKKVHKRRLKTSPKNGNGKHRIKKMQEQHKSQAENRFEDDLSTFGNASTETCKDADRPGLIIEGMPVSCPVLAKYCNGSNISRIVNERCPQTCGHCKLVANYSSCRDGLAFDQPQFKLSGVLAPCSLLRRFCGMFEKIRKKCPHTCRQCGGPIELLDTSTSTSPTTTTTGMLGFGSCQRRRRWGWCGK